MGNAVRIRHVRADCCAHQIRASRKGQPGDILEWQIFLKSLEYIRHCGSSIAEHDAIDGSIEKILRHLRCLNTAYNCETLGVPPFRFPTQLDDFIHSRYVA